jgi:hypothetical protein
VLPDKINPANGTAPAPTEPKFDGVLKLVPLVLTANTVPLT